MKLKKTLLGAVAAVLAVGMTQAGAATLNLNGDLFLGIRTTGSGSTNNYVIDIGQAYSFRDLAAGATITIGDFSSGLEAAFGSDWATRTDLYISLIGYASNNTSGLTTDGTNTIYVGRTATNNAAWKSATSSTQSGTVTTINNAVGSNGFQNAGNTAANGTSTYSGYVGAVIEDTTSISNEWQNYSQNGFGSYGSGGFEATGAALSELDLKMYRLVTSTASPKPDGTLEAVFSFDSNGVLSATAPVPEPSTWALLGIGLMAGFFFMRRRTVRA